MNTDWNNKIDQTKLNAISGRLLHQRGKSKYDIINNLVIVFTLIVPLVFIIAQYVSKGTTYENFVNLLSFVLSILLMAIAILALILKVNEKIVIHKMGMKNNNYVVNECDNIGGRSDSELEWFFRYVGELDNQDNDTFAKTSKELKRHIYREALKEFSPGNYEIYCPLCKSSPWKYIKGDCQLCGNKIS